MFLKIEVDSLDPVTYRLSRTDISIGSSRSCDIFIDDKTISKKHVRLIKEENEWYVVDQGSTNGTFVNEEQLVPGKRVKITPEESFRLGSIVFVTLTEEGTGAIELLTSQSTSHDGPKSSAQASLSSEQDRTKVISLDDLKQAKALADKKKAKELALKRAAIKKQKRKDAERIFKIILFSALILAIGVYFNRRWQKSQLISKKDTIVNKLKGQHKAKDEVALDVEGSRIGRSSLLSRNSVVDFLRESKCKSPELQSFCQLTSLKFGDSGAVQDKSNNVIFFAEETDQMKMAKSNLPMDSALDYDNLQKITYFLFLKDLFTGNELDPTKQYYVAFYRYDDQKVPQFSSAYAATGQSTQILINELSTFDFNQPDADIKVFVQKLDEYFTTY